MVCPRLLLLQGYRAPSPSNGNTPFVEQVCKEIGDEYVLVQCPRCRFFCHIGCFDPPLEEVPGRDWVCTPCTLGRPAHPAVLPVPAPALSADEQERRDKAGQAQAALLERVMATVRRHEEGVLFGSRMLAACPYAYLPCK